MQNPPREFGREELIKLIQPDDTVLEIGPFTRPIVRGPNVKYFDVLDRQGLMERAEAKNYKYEDAPEIDFVSPVGDLAVVDATFDVVISSHCIEHQPDLIRHLNQVEKILGDGGRYVLIVPDKRYCFDHFVPETTIAEVLDGVGRSVHTLGNIVRHRAMVTHNEPLRHWKGDHGHPRGIDNLGFVRQALREHAEAEGGYVDVHAWQFTPSGLRNLMEVLNTLELVRMRCEAIHATPYGRFEFCAILRKPAQVAEAKPG